MVSSLTLIFHLSVALFCFASLFLSSLNHLFPPLPLLSLLSFTPSAWLRVKNVLPKKCHAFSSAWDLFLSELPSCLLLPILSLLCPPPSTASFSFSLPFLPSLCSLNVSCLFIFWCFNAISPIFLCCLLSHLSSFCFLCLSAFISCLIFLYPLTPFLPRFPAISLLCSSFSPVSLPLLSALSPLILSLSYLFHTPHVLSYSPHFSLSPPALGPLRRYLPWEQNCFSCSSTGCKVLYSCA